MHGDNGAHCYSGFRHSLCHGWSAMPVYFYYAYGLGVRPVKPGFARTADAARRMDGCYGSVPTPEGMIHVEKKAK